MNTIINHISHDKLFILFPDNYCTMYITKLENNHVKIDNIKVDLQYRGRGHGTKVLNWLKSQDYVNSIQADVLYPHPESFYKKNGFIKTEPEGWEWIK